MDAFEINRLFSDQKFMKKYLKKDYIRFYDGRVQATHAKLTCHTLTYKLIDFSKAELVIEGYIEGLGANLVAGNNIAPQNGNYSLARDVKISFNNNEVEHNREPRFTTSYLNLLEYSEDYANSIAQQHGFYKQTSNVIRAQVNDQRRERILGTFAANQISCNCNNIVKTYK